MARDRSSTSGVGLPTAGPSPMRDPSVLDCREVTRELDVDPELGLSGDEAARRLEVFGPNELRGNPPEPAWRRLLRQLQDPLVYLLLVAIVIAVLAWLVEGGSGLPVDAIVIAVIVGLNAVIGYVQENKAVDAVAALRDMTAATSTVLRDGRLATVPAAQLVVGDVLVLGEGDAVGADARLLSATALRVQEASLTGESEARAKSPQTLRETVPLGDRDSMVFKGTAVSQGVGRAVVTATGMSTQMGSIAEMLDATESDPSPLTVEIDRVSKMLGVLVVIIALVVMGALFAINGVGDAQTAVQILLLGVSLAVAAVPEGLPAILTVVLALGVQRLARRNAVVKELRSVETLGAATVVCSDKTGTLTKNEMTIERVVTSSGEVAITGVGYVPEGRVEVAGETVADAALATEVSMLLSGGALANNAQLDRTEGAWGIQGDPTEAAFLVAARKGRTAPGRMARFERRGEVPFTSERKMMSTLHRDTGDGHLAMMAKGAPDVLLERCTHVQVGDRVVPLDAERRAAALDAVEELSGQAYRTLGVAYREIAASGSPFDDSGFEASGFDDSAEHDLVYLGVAGIIDPPRDEARTAVAEAHSAGVRTVMITGDHPTTATRIAADLGIVGPDARAVTGAELEELDEAALEQTVAEVSVYARVAPEHKLRIVDALQRQGHVVAMTGDGVNDAPALKSADIGVAMGITGTEVTKQSAKMILGDDDFATIVAAIRQGRVIFENIKKFLRYLLSSNMGEVVTVFFGVVLAGVIGLTEASEGPGLVLPLLATQILWINLVTDTGPALAMGVDPEIDDVMARRPRDPSERVIDALMWRGIILIGLVMGAVTLLTIDTFLPGGLVEGSDSLEVARTAGFTTLVLAQLFNALNSRSETSSAFHRLFVNPWLWGALALGVVLQVLVVEVPVLQAAFGTASLDLMHWAVCVAMASVVLWFDEVRKLVLRARARRPAPATTP